MLAAALRFFHFTDIPFTHDEFSAIRRTSYNSLSQLLNLGVKNDGHPALVQVFLYYYIQWVGPVEHWIKLPFILSGIGVVCLLYMSTRQRLGETSAIVIATLSGLLSYPLYFSQIARPYISGLFLVLMAFYFWQRLMYGKPKWWDFVTYSIALALCAYNHHFSALQAAIIALSGLFIVKADYRRGYLLSLFGAMVLYAPHLPIFIFQLQKGGVGGPEGWLPAPQVDFITHYLQYVFHFSWWMYGIAGLLVLWSFTTLKQGTLTRFRLLMLMWFAIPFAIGFAYSYWVNPVLQHSVLLFGFPFLLLFLFGGLPEIKIYKQWLLFAAVASIGVISLINERRYYELFYNSAYEEIVVETNRQESGKLKFINSHSDITAFYAERHALGDNVHYFNNSADLDSLSQMLTYANSTSLSYGNGPNGEEMIVGAFGKFYPYVGKVEYYHNGAFYELRKDKGVPLYKVKSCKPMIKDTADPAEWKLLYEGKVSNLISGKYDVIDANMQIGPLSKDDEVYWVWQVLGSNDTVLNWQAKRIVGNKEGTDYHSYFSLYMRDKHFPTEAEVKILIWNQTRTPIEIKEACIKVREGNPVKYGLYHPVP